MKYASYELEKKISNAVPEEIIELELRGHYANIGIQWSCGHHKGYRSISMSMDSLKTLQKQINQQLGEEGQK